MKEKFERDPLAERPNLDFSKGVRGKYFDRWQQGTGVVLIAPGLLATFPDSDLVNKALRGSKSRHVEGRITVQLPRAAAKHRVL